jgi:Ca-activated chloride channel family protein
MRQALHPRISASLALIVSLITLIPLYAPAAHAALPTVRMNDLKSPQLLYRTKDPGVFALAPTLQTDVDLRVTGFIARVTVTQTFTNSEANFVEGVYAFPLPENAAVDTLTMHIGERVIEGLIREKTEARKIFEQAKREGKKAALVEQIRPNLFTNSVANIGPGESVKVVITYQQELRYDQGQVRMRYPMAFTPRYAPDGARVDPAVGGAQTATAAKNPTRLRVTLDAGFPLGGVDAPHHAVDVERISDRRALVKLSDAPNLPDKDFVLQWNPRPFTAPEIAAYRTELGGKDYALFLMMPPTSDDARTDRVAKEQTFIIDTSGSMSGASMDQAKKALLTALGRLQPEDTFNLIEFNSTATQLWPKPRPAVRLNVEQARGFVEGLAADGGTEMFPALELALAQPVPEEGRVSQIVFITDGAVANEDQLFQLITEKLSGRRLFTVGIGSAPNSFFMTKAAQFGKGTFTFIGSPAEVEEKMGGLFAKLDAPVIGSLALDVEGENVEMFPPEIGDLFLGEPIVVAVRGDDLGDELRLKGKRGDKRFSTAVKLTKSVDDSGVEKLWARRKIATLLDDERVGAGSRRTEVIEVALKHHLVSKYTSLVAVDVTKSRPDGSPLEQRRLAAPPPGSLPSGGTSSTLMILVGFALLAGAWISMRASKRGVAA